MSVKHGGDVWLLVSRLSHDLNIFDVKLRLHARQWRRIAANLMLHAHVDVAARVEVAQVVRQIMLSRKLGDGHRAFSVALACAAAALVAPFVLAAIVAAASRITSCLIQHKIVLDQWWVSRGSVAGQW